MERGYLKMWRKSIDSAVFADPDLWRLWCLCLMKATHKKRFVSMEGTLEPVELQPGQFVTGRFALHGDFYPRKKKKNKSPYTVWRWLEILQKCENLSIKTHNKYSVITIKNWPEYQCDEQHVSNRRATGEQHVSTNKNVKNVKKKDILSGSKPNNGIPYAEIVSFLNEKTGTSFKPSTKTTKYHIKARFNEGHSLDDFKAVIALKADEWMVDDRMVKFLRPQTLFGTKFEGYLQEATGLKDNTPKKQWVTNDKTTSNDQHTHDA